MQYTLNLGLADRFIRTLIAIVIGSIGAYYQSWWGLLAIIPLAQALAGWCPIYRLFNTSTFSEPHGPQFNRY